MNKRTCSIVLALGLVSSGLLAGPATAAKKKAKACKAMTPAAAGAEAPTVVVTDSHTADAPLLQPVTLAESVGDADLIGEVPDEGPLASSHSYFNVQVDSKAKTAGLYVTFEFPEHRDYDLWAYFSDGTVAASSHGFQPGLATAATPADLSNTATNHAGESTPTSENLIGVITNDCGGYTIETANWLGEGGDFEVKLWLGEGVTAAGAPE